MSEEIKTVFQALQCSGENFYNNKKELDSVRDHLTNIYEEAKESFQKINRDATNQTSAENINQYIFESLHLREPAYVEYERRRECTPEEEKLIKDDCEIKGKGKEDVENIKHALGFLSDNHKSVPFKKPCVAVVGQTKAGKSTLINTLLGSVIVPQRVTKLTSRVTRITYCETKFVALMNENKLQEIRVDKNVENEDVDLDYEFRYKREKVNIEVRVGCNNHVLRNGFDIVDSPGLNENPALNDLCKQMEKSLTPLLIYVIDGRMSLTETDVGDIRKIRDRSPELNINYFVTKLDRSQSDRGIYNLKKMKKGYRLEDDMPGQSDWEVANRRLTTAFTRLQKYALISATQKVDRCPAFNGANLSLVEILRHRGGQPTTDLDNFIFKLFEKFELNLLNNLREMINKPLEIDIQSLNTGLESVLEHTTICASNIEEEKQEKRMCVREFRAAEEKLYKKQADRIREDLNNEISDVLDAFEANLIEIINKECMNPILESFRSRRFNTSDLVEKTLKTQMEDFVRKFMLQTDELLVQDLESLVKPLCSGKCGLSSFQEMLKNRLYYEYDLSSDCYFTGPKGNNLQSSKSNKENKILSGIRGALDNLQFSCRRRRRQQQQQQQQENVDTPDNEARQILSELEREDFLNSVCTKITDQFTKCHERFGEKLNEEENFLNCKLDIGEMEKEYFETFSKRLGVLYLRTYIVNTRICLVFDPLRDSELVGEGRQAKLTKVYLINRLDPVVMKTYHTPYREVDFSIRGLSLGLEVYSTRCIQHPRFLQLMGIKTEQDEEGLKFSNFYPYLPLGSVKEYLESNSLSLKSRLKLGMEIAEGLEYLHKMKIIHRDVTLKNILVKHFDSGLHAVIGDFGVLCSLGCAGKEQVGTPYYYPPETYDLAEMRSIGYTFASDVYSFGISLWQLLTYKLCDEYENFEPKFVLDCEYDEEKVKLEVVAGRQPERRNLIPNVLSQYLERCCSVDRSMRPSFVRSKAEVRPTVNQNYEHCNKTIYEFLKHTYDSMLIET